MTAASGATVAHEIPIEDVIDLHAFNPRDVAAVVDDYVTAAHEAGLREVRLIHGRGKGVQRGLVQRALDRHPLVEEFWDATETHLGATIARLVSLTVLLLFLLGGDALAQARTVRIASELGEQVAAILLPAGYDDSDRRYPVVYLFHGAGQNHTAFMARNAFRTMAAGHDVIVVMPAADRGYGARSPEAQAAYHEFVATALVDYVDGRYRTIGTREGRAIGGISMGGRIATLTALAFPDRFGAVAALSAALPPDLGDAVAAAGGAGGPWFHVSCGTADRLLPVSDAFVARLREHGVPHDYHVADGLGHTWELWDAQVGVFFDELAGRGFASRPDQP